MTPSPLRLAFSLVWRHRASLGGSVACHLAERLLLLTLPILATRLVSQANASGTLPRAMIAWLCLAIVVLAALRYVGTYAGVHAQERGIRSLRRALVRRAMLVPLHAIQDQRPGEIAALIGPYSEQLAHFASDTLRMIVPTIVTLAGALGMLLYIDPALGITIIPTLVFAIIGIRLLSRTTRPASAVAIESSTQLEGLVEETVELLPAVRAAGAEQRHLAHHEAALDSLLAARLREQRAMSWFGALSMLLASLSLLLLLLVGTSKMTAGIIEPLELVRALLFTLVLLSPLGTVANTYGRLRKSSALSSRIARLLAGPMEDLDAGDQLPPGPGAVRFDGVSFSYPGRPALIENLSLAIAPKQTTALVGPNGAGKTTIIRLLMRLLPVDAGTMYIDDADISTTNLRSLRAAIAMVAQRDFVAHGTIRDNIDFGPADLTDEQVEHAATRAGLHDFIMTLPENYNTFVGSGGAALSGGQRKLLMLARALSRTPRILIMDEPTSMLDQRARTQVIAAIAALRGTTTVIVATHDPEVITAADQSVEIERQRQRQ